MLDFIRYVGYSDAPTQEQMKKHPAWSAIPDTAEAIQLALDNGYTAISTTALSHEPQSKKPEPIRKGSLFLDIDCKEDQAKGIAVAQSFIHFLYCRYFVNLEGWRFWLSGGKGCHIEIPVEVFGAEAGDSYLPQTYKWMVQNLIWLTNLFGFKDYFDLSMYCMGKGKLLRQENILRANECYKVPVTSEEFLTMSPKELIAFTHSPRELPSDTQRHKAEPFKLLCNLYIVGSKMNNKSQQKRYPITSIEALMNCDFMKHCRDKAETLSEPEWFAMVNLLSPLEEFGKILIHHLSTPYPGYSYEKTEEKRMYALTGENKGRITCAYIKNYFSCNKQCSVSSPCDLWKIQKIEESNISSSYVSNDDGLFYISGNGELEKICSPIKVICKMCSPDNLGWGRLVRIQNSLGEKELELFMRDLVKSDLILGILLNAGLEIFNASLAKKHIPQYILTGAQFEGVRVMTNQLGWFDGNYVLPDVTYGSDVNIMLKSNGLENIHQSAMELKDWQKQIGDLCKGNSLLVLATSMALTGPMLRPCEVEGVGINIFGPSSSGKTSLALVAGSVCGGGARNGYVRSWRSTDNALEATASMHNDGLLILDEIGQAMGDTVGRIVYMVANGEGKSRMSSEAILRKTSQWTINLLSTGELTIADKILESGRMKPMAGQEVRIIDLPIDADCGSSLYENLHGCIDGAQLSNTLSERAKQYYGTALRSFLEHLCKEPDMYAKRVVKEMEIFVTTHCPTDASGQVQRVCRKFALIASVGELAIEFGVFPYEKEEPSKAAVRWFHIWLTRRAGIGNLEVEKALKAIQETIELQGATHFVDTVHDSHVGYIQAGYLGYRWKDGGQHVYFILAPHFTRLCGNANKASVETELKKRGMVKLNQQGSIMETKSVKGENHRGIGILIPTLLKKPLATLPENSPMDIFN